MSAIDIVDEAARALRDMAPPAMSRTDGCERVLSGLAARRARRTALTSLAVAAVMLAGGSTAWAAVTGRLPRVLEDVRALFSRNEAPPTRPTPPRPTRSPRVPTQVVPAVVTPPDAPPPPVVVARPAVERATAHDRWLAAPRAAAIDPDALYAAAHELHFRRADTAQSLAAWDRYLAADPHGRFELEARFNRAAALIRLSRWDEAEAALAPFAQGLGGRYRQHEAQTLLDALRAR